VKIPSAIEPTLRASSLTLLSLFAGCGGGGGGGGSGGGGAPSDVEAALNDLGVDTTATARRDGDGDALPASYSPFGATWELAKTDELLAIGLNLTATGAPFSLVDLTSDTGGAVVEVLEAKGASEASWAREGDTSRALPSTLRAACAADLDGDGLEEAAVAYMDGLELHLVMVEDEPSAFLTTEEFLSLELDVTNVALTALDADGDGVDELAVGLTQGGQGVLLFARRTPSGIEPFGRRIELAPVLPAPTLWLQLATGNIDHDRAQELVAVIDEEERDFQGNPSYAARFLVLDDAASGFATLAQDSVQGRDQASVLRTAIVASPALGDVDGDGLDEVLLGGLTAHTRSCAAAPYLLLARDDADHGLVPLAGRYFEHFYDDCDSPNDPRVRTVHLNALDIDGDGRVEVQANRFVFQDWVEAAPWTEVTGWRLPETVFWRPGDFGHLERNTSAVVTGDFTGDERDDVAIYRQDTSEIVVYGVSATSVPSAISRMRAIPVAFHNAQDPVNPILVPLNTDTDSPVLKYSEGEYRLVFTEPIVLAALAAAPFKNGIMQNVDACSTAFGNTETSGTEEERSVTFTASASVGVNIDGGALSQSEFELKVTATAEATRLTSHAYTLSKTILFTSGPREDLVVFTTVPIDQYTFTIVSHPDPTLIGDPVVVNLPRDPITLQAERGFYNRTVQAGSVRIDERVFGHVLGDPASYPTRTDRASLLNQHGGLSVGPVSVGQGTGETEVTLEVGTELGQGGALELGFEVELEATAGSILGGVSIGASQTDTFRVTSGTSTTYTGVVGAIDAADFSANRYSFGLFTYVYRDPATGQEFEVLDYWVE
jgi:hypothetical protein